MLEKSLGKEISREMYFNWLHGPLDRMKLVEGRNGADKRWILTNKKREIIPDLECSSFVLTPIYWLFLLLTFPTTVKWGWDSTVNYKNIGSSYFWTLMCISLPFLDAIASHTCYVALLLYFWLNWAIQNTKLNLSP